MLQPLVYVPAPAAAGSSLLTGLVSYYKLDEGSGTRIDSHGSNNLVDSGSTPNIVGIQGNAASFSNSTYLSSSSTDFRFGDEDFTIAGWIRRNASTFIAFGRYSTTGQKCYGLRVVNGVARFYVTDNGSTDVFVETASGIAFADWAFVAMWHDSVNDTISVQLNDDVPVSVTHTTGVFAGTVAFTVGAGTGGDQSANADMDEIGIWNRVLTTQERTDVYNSGAGATYPFS